MTASKPNYLRPTNLRSPSSKGFWEGLEHRNLRGRRCVPCGERFFPPRPRCPQCLSAELEWVNLDERGTLHSWTEVYLRSPDFDTPTTAVSTESNLAQSVTSRTVPSP